MRDIIISNYFDVRYYMELSAHDKNANVFKALSDPKRLAVIASLRSGEKCAADLLSGLELIQSGLSYHMKILCASGIVKSRQDGKWTYYSLSPEGRDEAAALLAALTTPSAAPVGGERKVSQVKTIDTWLL